MILFQVQPAASSPQPPAKLVYTVPEADELLWVSANTVHRLIERGLLGSAGGMRHKRITPAEIERYLRAKVGGINGWLLKCRKVIF
jgi:Helix-turn-helix domain